MKVRNTCIKAEQFDRMYDVNGLFVDDDGWKGSASLSKEGGKGGEPIIHPAKFLYEIMHQG